MTKAQDIRELIAEQSADPGERRALETVANVLQETLAEEVPYLPEFRTELRRHLMVQAHRTLNPWYRRPAVLSMTAGMAAAVAVLAVGLRLWQPGVQPGTPEITPPNPGTIATRDNNRPVQPFTVSETELQAFQLADEPLLPGAAGPESLAGLDLSEGLRLYAVTGRPNQEQFLRIASSLGFSGQHQVLSGSYAVAQGAKSLTVAFDGKVTYTDDEPEPQNAPGSTVDANGAKVVARRFLDKAALPVPGMEIVTETSLGAINRVYMVSYTPRVEGRPVVNGRTVIYVTGHSRVARAEAFVSSSVEVHRSYPAVLPEQAVRVAQDRDGNMRPDGADLVYARSSTGEGIYLQPFWRVYGTDSQGKRMVRYVSAWFKE